MILRRLTPEEIALRIALRQRFVNWWLRLWIVDPWHRCPHLNQRGIYGDEIIAAGYNRARCLDCGKLLPDLPKEVKRWGLSELM